MTQISFDKAVAIALEQHQAGNFARAERLYMEILRQDPSNVDAMHLLGVLARQGKNPEAAVQLISAAIRKKPDAAIFHYNLAEALNNLARWQEAIDSYERAIALEPDFLAAHNNLASLLNDHGRFEEAERHSQTALDLDPGSVIALNNLGTALRGLQRPTEALERYRAAHAQDPKFLPAIVNLAMCLCYLKRMEEGIEFFQRAIQLDPTSADTHNNLGIAYTHLGRLELAGAAYQTAIDLDPNHAPANNNLGSTLRSLGKAEESIPFLKKATELKPDFVEAHLNLAITFNDLQLKAEAVEATEAVLTLRPTLAQAHFLKGVALRDLSRLDEAIESMRRALEAEPDYAAAHTALGYALLERGELDDAMAELSRSIALKPDPVTHSNVLMTMNYHPGFSPAELLVAHRGWAELHERPHAASWRPHDNDRSPDRKLRVGYVSPDFRGHSVSYFFAPILDHHNHEQFEIYGYAHLTQEDMSTWRLRAQLDQWRETSGKSPAEIAEQIRADRIDILIELAGHTANNSLPVFALKPAPVQINMIGFPSTTGLSGMDYRITDALCDPPGESDAFNTERLIRLPELFWVFEPPHKAPAVGALPVEGRDGQVTFASVNNFTKVTPQVQELWAKLLVAVPNSRLILQTAALASEYTRRAVTERFAAHGVPADRLEFRRSTPLADFLQFLDRECDLTLDPFPFNGGTTTCQSLWMGVPVLTLAGDRHAARMGLSMMTAIGLEDLVAHTPEQFVEIGAKLCADLPRLRELRSGMRDRLRASPLLDAAGYTAHLEAAYRQVWQTWCATGD